MLTIGEFSKICFVSKKTLRHYDEIGLLRPEYTAENGYRYYTSGQLRTMLMITRLKSYGFSLPEIASVLANPDKAALAGKLAEKRQVMEAEMQNTRHILRQLDQDVDKLNRSEDIMDQDIMVKTVELPALTLLSVRKNINVQQEFGDMMGQLFAKIGQSGVQPVGPPVAIYHQPDFNPENSDVEVAVPVAPGTPDTYQREGGLHCFATILGAYEHEKFTATYAALQQWVEQNGYQIVNSPIEKYAKGGPGENPEDNVTEVYFPIAKK